MPGCTRQDFVGVTLSLLDYPATKKGYPLEYFGKPDSIDNLQDFIKAEDGRGIMLPLKKKPDKIHIGICGGNESF